MQERTYKFGGHAIRVILEEPWAFKQMTEAQQELVDKLRRGEDPRIKPVPADKQEEMGINDGIMGKQLMTRERWDAMTREERIEYRHTLDFIQYAPFEVPAEEPLFTFRVQSEEPEWLQKVEESGAWEQVVAVDEVPPFYYGYVHEGRTIYAFYPVRDICAGIFVMEPGYKEGTYYPKPRIGAAVTMMQVNTSLMIQYTFTTAPYSTLLLHASVTRYKGEANLLFGVSGTGKSTHSRLWLEHVEGTDFMNDDNPVVRFEDGRLMVYGSPWSGKTTCYRNVKAPVRALVRLEQAPVNRAERLLALQAYASVVAAVSTIRWNHSIMDHLIPTIEKVAMEVPCFRLECRPDEEAVRVSFNAINSVSNA